MPLPLLVFDFDGVLVDSEVIANEIVASVLTAFGHSHSPSECHRRFTGLIVADIRTVVETDTGQPLAPEFEELVRVESSRRMVRELKAVPGAADALRVLSGRRCIASNSGPNWIKRALRAVELDRFFPRDALFSAAQVERAKPAPDLFLHAAASMQVDPSDCLVIEDSVHGVAGARAAGMRVIGFAGASHIEAGHADLLLRAGVETVFDDLARLPDLVRDL